MKISFLLFIFITIYCNIFYNETVSIYSDHNNNIYFNKGNAVYQIINPTGFGIQIGNAKISYEIDNGMVILKEYKYIKELKNIELKAGEKYSAAFTKLQIGIYRGAFYRRAERDCLPLATIDRYVFYVDLGLRLWTANQMVIDKENLYVSSKCLEIDKSFYDAGNLGNLNTQLTAAAAAIDGNRGNGPYATKWFLTDDFVGDWLGMAAVGSAGVIANKNSNYWMFCKYNPDPPDDKNLGRITTIQHEFGHNYGLGHATVVNPSESGGFINWHSPDGYEDWWSFMGAYGWVYSIPTSSHYINVATTTNKGYEPFYFKEVDTGVHTYRIYAWDHPFSRYVLGVTESYYSENDTIGGIPARNNLMGIIIPITKEICSGLSGSVRKGTIMLEYRREKKLRVIYGPSNADGFNNRISYWLDANIDKLDGWSDSYIPLGVNYIPSNVDAGTLRIRFSRVHTAEWVNLDTDTFNTEKKQYTDAQYVEVEVDYRPGVKYTKPTNTPALPNIKTSPSFFNCHKNNDDNGYKCSYISTSSGWTYMEESNERNVNVPRIYLLNNNELSYRYGIRSYNGKVTTNHKQCYGTNGFRCITFEFDQATNRGSLSVYSNARVEKITKNGDTEVSESIGEGPFIILTDIEIPSGGRVYLTDLYYTEFSMNIKGNAVWTLLPKLEVDGMFEGAVVIKDSSGSVVNYKGFTLYKDTNGNRVALSGSNGKYTASPASLFGYYTTTSMIGKHTINKNSWFYYPLLDLQDYSAFFVDFSGELPTKLVMSIETDNGVYDIDLSDLGKCEDITYKLSCFDLNGISGGFCQVYKFKFNKKVTLLNIRPVFSSAVGDQIKAVNGGENTFDLNEYKLKITADSNKGGYTYSPVNADVRGDTVKLNEYTSTKSLKLTAPMETYVLVLIIVGVCALLILIIGCFILYRRKKSSQKVYRPGQTGNLAYPGRGMPPRGMPPRGMPPRGMPPSQTMMMQPGPRGMPPGSMPPRGMLPNQTMRMPPPSRGPPPAYSGGYTGGYR